MAMLFRQRYRAQQAILIQALDYVAHWPRLFDFFALLISHAGRQHETSFIEQFLDGAYRLHFLLTAYDFETMLVDVVNPETVPAVGFGSDAPFLDGDPQLHQLLSIVTRLAAASGGVVDLQAIDRFKGSAWLCPDKAVYHHYLGVAQSEIPNLRKSAEQSFLKAIEIEKTAAITHLELAKLYVKVNLRRKAEQQLQELLRWDPENKEAHRLLDELNRPETGQFGRNLKNPFARS